MEFPVGMMISFRSAVERAETVLRAIPEEQSGARHTAGGWTRKQILGHLLDSAVNNHLRFARAAIEGGYDGPGYDQQAWVRLHLYDGQPWTELVDAWATHNRRLACLVEALSPGSLAAPCRVGDTAASLGWWIEDYLRHLEHHTAQIAEAQA